MAYSVDLRERALEYYKNGNTKAETCRVFKIAIFTLNSWLELAERTGSLEKKILIREPRIFKSEELKKFVEGNPFATLKEIGDHFGGSATGAKEALDREKITLKKRQLAMKNGAKKSEQNSMSN